jgi:RimJ/RimL family protein N-acetyltransferase
VVLQTSRLTLREVVHSDLDFLARMLAHPEVSIRPVNVPSRRVAERIGLAPGREVAFHGFRHIVYECRPPAQPPAVQ